MDSTSKITPTTVAELVNYCGGEVVELPGFLSDKPFYCRLRRPSMLALAKDGKIPNSLLSRAGELFSRGSRSVDPDDANMLSEMYDVMKVICDAAMVEPTLAQVEEAGLTLTDSQMTAIFAYTQNGVNKLTQFRGQQEGLKPDLNFA